MNITIHHQGTKHPVSLPPNATLTDLTTYLAQTLHIPPTHQKLLIAPKPGLLKPPFAENTPLESITALDSPKFKITVLGTPTAAIDALNADGENTKRKTEAREASRAEASRKLAQSRSSGSGSGKGGIHTLSDNKDSYTFHKLEPLPYLPYPSRSLDFLKSLRDDPGIRTAMAKHKFSVPVLTEMNPVEHTTQEGRTLGLNRNRGEVIELRLRTDAYDGYRDYRTIRKTLCHELAHCVHGDHDRAFWDLTSMIEKEVERADWTRGGRSLGGEFYTPGEFYNPGDWEASSRDEFVDHGGWSGGSFVLGSGSGAGAGAASGSSSGTGTGSTGDDRREKMARAAEERLKKQP